MIPRKLLLLGCGFEQLEALRIARELGYRTVAFDNDADAVGRAYADEFVHVDLKNVEALVGQAEIVAPDGVFVHAAELAVEAAILSESLGLPGLSIETARNATDKSLRIEKLSASGIQTPRFEILSSRASIGEWLEQTQSIAYPKVLKPTNQAGARGVERISARADLEAYYHRRREFNSDDFVCEELLAGVQLSTESVAVEGKIVHHALALRHYDTTASYLPFFIEDGHSLPFVLSPPQQSAVENVIERSFIALGITSGVLKGDLLITDAGEIYVLEMAARTSGGRFADTVVPLGTGVNILYPLIEMAMGDSLSEDWFTPIRNTGVSQRFILHSESCQVTRWPHLRRLLGQPGVAEWRIDQGLFRTGTLPTIRSHRDRLGYVICTGETREEADRLAREITTELTTDLRTQLSQEVVAQ